MSQNVWATIMPFGPVTNFLLAQKNIFGPANAGPHFRHCIHFVKSKLLKGQFIPGGNLIF
jgi:hypothetical protein